MLQKKHMQRLFEGSGPPPCRTVFQHQVSHLPKIRHSQQRRRIPSLYGGPYPNPLSLLSLSYPQQHLWRRVCRCGGVGRGVPRRQICTKCWCCKHDRGRFVLSSRVLLTGQTSPPHLRTPVKWRFFDPTVPFEVVVFLFFLDALSGEFSGTLPPSFIRTQFSRVNIPAKVCIDTLVPPTGIIDP